ncbi:MAG: glycosyltransferase family 39 protein, partial [Anaerolineales bacterium]|nr:glycosyltransferase family 39 protein [Anaerolineales bacterium]
MSRIPSREKVILAAILALAACLRFYRLDEIPPGFQFDQAYYVFDAIFLLRGDFFIFFRDPGRSEPLFQYLLMPFVAFFDGDTPLGPQVTAGIIGVATIFLIFGIARALFRSTRVALLAAFFAAISFWHIFYCRYGERIPLTLFFATLAFWFFWRALGVSGSTFKVQSSTHPSSLLTFDFLLLTCRGWRDYVLTGIFTGLTLYTYPSGRIVPVALILLTAYVVLTDRARAAYYIKGLVFAGMIATIVFLPLGVYYIQHPVDFISHTADVSIFTPHGEIGDNIPLELGKNALKILGMFFVVGDSGVLRNLPYLPVFDPFVGALFVVGVIVWIAELVLPKTTRVNRLRAVFLAVWLGLALALSLISDDAPNNGRILIGLPVVMILPALGAVTIWERLQLLPERSRRVTRGVAAIALSAIVIVSATLVARNTFVVWTSDPGTYYAFDA